MKKFKAFTLAEVLIVFVIIGVIATVGLNTVRPWEKALKHSYSRIYNALGIAIYNYVVNNEDGVHAFPGDRTDESGNNVKGAETFCNGLAYYMNNIENHCSDAYLTNNPDFSNFRAVADGGTRPHLVLSNGVKLWIGANGTDAFNTEIHLSGPSGIKDEVIYYLVYADLTGDRKPNSPIWRPNKPADVVAFAVTNQFVVVPLGYPIVDRRYLSAHVMVPSSSEDTGDDIETPTDPMSFYEATTYAYGRWLRAKGNALTYHMDLNHEIFPKPHSALIRQSFVVDNCNRLGSTYGCVHKVTGEQTDYYPSQPQFNSTYCGLGSASCGNEGAENKYCEPVCNVKIYDYH